MQENIKLSPEQSALLKKFNAAVEKKRKRLEPSVKEWDKWRGYVRGKQHLNDGKLDPEEVRSNLILGINNTLVPLYYAKDPQIDVRPSERLQPSEYGAIKTFCKTLEMVLQNQFIKRGKLKRRMTRAISSAFSAPVSWFKISYQKDWGKDPLSANRISDAQDNLAEIERLIAEVEKAEPDHLAKKAELESQIAAIENQVDVVLQEGLVIDRELCENIIILDDSICSFSDYAEANAIAHLVPMSCEDYKTRFGKEAKGTKYSSKDVKKSEENYNKESDSPDFVLVCEIWSKQHSTVYTFNLGAHEWARAPYQPTKIGERFYPFFALYFNDLDGGEMPLTEVSQWAPVQDEYSSMRTQLAQVRRENRPGFIYRMGGSLTDKDVQSFVNRGGNTVIGIQGLGAKTPLSNDLFPFPTVTIDPTVYDPTPIMRDLEQAAGISDASRQMIISTKTATEAEIAASGQQSKTAYRVDQIEELIAEMATFSAQLLLSNFTEQQVEKITGPGYVWPDMPKEDIFALYTIEIVAGSTGKPNQRKEQDAWAKLAPEINRTIELSAQMEQMGALQQSKALKAVLKETLRRFDQRLDLAEFGLDDVQQDGSDLLLGMPQDMPPPALAPPADAPADPQLPAPVETVPLSAVMQEFGGALAMSNAQIAQSVQGMADAQSMADQTQSQSLADASGAMQSIAQNLNGVVELVAQQQQNISDLTAAVQENSEAISQSARIAAAPKIPVYVDGKVVAVVPRLEG